MIEVLSQGRLGNQMFQFAFGYAASRRLRTMFLMRNSHLGDYFCLGMPYRLFHLRNRLMAFLMARSQNPTKILVDNLLIPHEALKTLRDNAIYSGFFQSEMFFKDYKRDIVRLFRILPVHREKFINKYGELFAQHKVVAVHIRRTDYAEFPPFGIKGGALLPFSYFWHCLDRIEELEDHQVIFVSDEIDAVAKEFRTVRYAMFESNETIVDFQILQNADIVIISNSSFSWWAAYLNRKSGLVFAPKYWLGFRVRIEYPAGAVAERWRAVDVSKII